MLRNFAVIIECPLCGAQFETELKEFADGPRQVKCSSCQNVWKVSKKEALLNKIIPSPETENLAEKISRTPETDDIIVEEVAEEESDENLEEELEEDSTTSRGGSKLLSVSALVGLLLMGGYFGRNWVMTVLPRTQPLYEWMNLSPVPSLCFKLQNTSWSLTTHNGAPAVEVKGTIQNISKVVRQPPSVHIKLNGTGECLPSTWMDDIVKPKSDFCILYQRTLVPQKKILLPTETVEFSAVYSYAESANIKEVLIDFAP